MKIAIHQPNFIPWFPFFQKMAESDIFVFLTRVQFEKNGWTNRCQVQGKWWTNPVNHGLDPIREKTYTSGVNLLHVNCAWIVAMAATLGIDTHKIAVDFDTDKRGTERLIEICQHFHGDEYLTNMEALEKYLDASLFLRAGIKIVPFVPKSTKHVFELFDEIGIEKTRKLLWSSK